MNLKFTADIRDPNTNLTFGYDQDFVLEVEAKMVNGEPFIDITEVWLDGVEMLTSNSEITKRIGCAIADEASNTEWIIEEALDDAGYGWRGRGHNDPDGEFAERQMRRVFA